MISMKFFSNRTKRSADESSCGLSDSSIQEWMKKVQNSAVEDPLPVNVILNYVLCGASYLNSALAFKVFFASVTTV